MDVLLTFVIFMKFLLVRYASEWRRFQTIILGLSTVFPTHVLIYLLIHSYGLFLKANLTYHRKKLIFDSIMT